MKELSRRNFLRNTALTLGSAALAPGVFASGSLNETVGNTNEPLDSGMIWGNLIHLSYNMWCDRLPDKWGKTYTHDQMHYVKVSDTLRFDDKLWFDITEQMAKVGMNMVVIDIGDGIQFASHPEISVKNAWPITRLTEELVRLRSIGLEPIPKLNFSTAHDEWLHQYARMISTPAYYKVCADLITEVAALFSKPRFFHIGYDEETAGNQSAYALSIVRQHELWWHDFNFIVDTVRAQGCRPWMWSDYEWEHPEDFNSKMPKNILQSNWYYGLEFNKPESKRLNTFRELEKNGYDQIPTGSNWNSPESFGKLAAWCLKEIPGLRLKGFLQTPWFPTLEPFREWHIQAVENVAAAIKASKLQSP
jgi:hypothetical protein